MVYRFFAIPNKIVIHNKIPNWLLVVVLLLMLLIATQFPIIVTFYIIFWIIVIKSFVFAKLYQEKLAFKQFFDRNLFESNPNFSTPYFHFFWGNMKTGAVEKAKVAVYGGATWVFGRLVLSHENTIINTRTNEEAARFLKASQKGYPNPQDAMRHHKKIREYVIDRGDASATKFLRDLNVGVKKVGKEWGGCGNNLKIFDIIISLIYLKNMII